MFFILFFDMSIVCVPFNNLSILLNVYNIIINTTISNVSSYYQNEIESISNKNLIVALYTCISLYDDICFIMSMLKYINITIRNVNNIQLRCLSVYSGQSGVYHWYAL